LFCSRLVKAETEYTAVRYVPLVKNTLEALTNGELSLDDYPSVTPMPAQATARTNNGKSSKSGGGSAVVVGSARKRDGGTASRFTGSDGAKRSTGPTNFSGGRSIVFIVGGCCYSELRVAREVMETQSREIIMGGTSFMTSGDFLDDLNKLAEENRR
jgi:Sec1 family